MYCNKCGKKNADNINFCVHCGAKMDVENQSVMQKKVIMKCIECGKTFENGTKFCTNCGGDTIPVEQPKKINDNIQLQVSSAIHGLGSNGIKIIELIPTILFGILGLIYLITAIKEFEGNYYVFNLVDDNYKILGIMLHWIICAVVVGGCIYSIFKAFTSINKSNDIEKTSIKLLVVTVILWIGKIVWNEFEFSSISIVLYRIFNTYGNLTSISFLLLIICFVFGRVSKKMRHN